MECMDYRRTPFSVIGNGAESVLRREDAPQKPRSPRISSPKYKQHCRNALIYCRYPPKCVVDGASVLRLAPLDSHDFVPYLKVLNASKKTIRAVAPHGEGE